MRNKTIYGSGYRLEIKMLDNLFKTISHFVSSIMLVITAIIGIILG